MGGQGCFASEVGVRRACARAWARVASTAAIQTAGFEFPVRKLTVNLAPAEFPKESGRFDLPIAIGILVASGQLPATRLKGMEFAGGIPGGSIAADSGQL